MGEGSGGEVWRWGRGQEVRSGGGEGSGGEVWRWGRGQEGRSGGGGGVRR